MNTKQLETIRARVERIRREMVHGRLRDSFALGPMPHVAEVAFHDRELLLDECDRLRNLLGNVKALVDGLHPDGVRDPESINIYLKDLIASADGTFDFTDGRSMVVAPMPDRVAVISAASVVGPGNLGVRAGLSLSFQVAAVVFTRDGEGDRTGVVAAFRFLDDAIRYAQPMMIVAPQRDPYPPDPYAVADDRAHRDVEYGGDWPPGMQQPPAEFVTTVRAPASLAAAVAWADGLPPTDLDVMMNEIVDRALVAARLRSELLRNTGAILDESGRVTGFRRAGADPGPSPDPPSPAE